MPRFENPHVSFEVPDDWIEHTSVVYRERVDGVLPAVISLVRNPLRGETLEAAATRIERRYVTDVPATKILERNAFLLHDVLPAIQLLLECRHPAGAMTQLVTIFVREETLWTFTASIPSARLMRLDPLVQRVLASLEVRPVTR